MRFKPLLALLVSAALALSLLAGCGGGKNQSLAQIILNLLDDQYTNVTVQLDPDLEADLRQAVNEGETDAEIRAALEKLLGSGVSFRLIGDGQKGDSAWNLILYPGSDPDAAARSAYLEWDKIFSAFPSSGLYTAKLSMIETENGYAILVKATVDKAARRNDDDDDEPEEPKGPGYTVDDDGNYTVNTPEGLQELFSQKWDEVANATITLPEGEYNISGTFGDKDTPFTGTLQGESPDKKATIKLQAGSRGLFAQIGVNGSPDENNGTVENITFDVETTITDTYTYTYSYATGGSAAEIHSGAVAGYNYGTITNCEVKLNGHTIQADDDNVTVRAGGIAGQNDGTITSCTVTGGTITATGTFRGTYAGGLVGNNSGSVAGTYSSTSEIAATSWGDSAYVGGLAGENSGSGSVAGTWSGSSITAKTLVNSLMYTATANSNSTTDKAPSEATKYDIRAAAGTGIGYDGSRTDPGPVGADELAPNP